MKKMEKVLIALILTSTLLMTGVSFAQQGNTNSNNANSNAGQQNGNTNTNANGNTNANMGGNMNANTNSGMTAGTTTGMGSATIGNMSREEFDRINAAGAAAVAAITPTNTPLSNGDQKLMMEVAMGGMMQLEMSRVGVQRATSEEARVLAQSEVEEQTALAAKLQAIATAKGVTLPAAPDAKTQSAVTKLQGATNFDRDYVRQSGVKGHQKLDKVMTRVQSRAADDNLKALAAAAHPLVRTHLQVSQEVLSKMTGRSGSNAQGGANANTGNANTNANNQ